MSQVDLHVHTTASDGELAPAEAVRKAVDDGVMWLGITDHDSTEGVAEAQKAASSLPVEIIPGVEINADFARTELHVLGYYVDVRYEPLQQTLSALRASRLERGKKMVGRLAALGLPLSWARVTELAGEGSAVGRPHVAQAMVELGYVSSREEAFLNYIGRAGPAYVTRLKLAPAAAISLIRASGGVPVLAHPLKLMDMVPQLVGAGLAGLEAYYTGYAPHEVALLIQLAQRHGLLVTGGSDFHGPSVLPEFELGGVDVPVEAALALQAWSGRTAEGP